MTKFLAFLCAALSLSAQTSAPSKLEPGHPAPALTFSKLLHAPENAKADWPSLKGKAVVLEFWATWCAPCIGKIPVLNALAASVDPNKVLILSIDDEDTALVESFLKSHPMSGWIGLDASHETLKRYSIGSWPSTFVVGPDGVIASNEIPPEQLTPEQLMALADGKPVKLGGPVDPAVNAMMDAATKKAQADQAAPGSANGVKALFEITLTPAAVEAGGKTMTHIMSTGKGQLDITNAGPITMLQSAAGLERFEVTGKIPDTRFNLHIHAPEADQALLNQAIELAVASGTGVKVQHISKTAEVYVLTAGPGAASHFNLKKGMGGAWVDQNQEMQCMLASPAKLASALEAYLEKPVVDETGILDRITTKVQLGAKDVAAVNTILAKEFDLKLVPASRTIQTAVISPAAK